MTESERALLLALSQAALLLLPKHQWSGPSSELHREIVRLTEKVKDETP